MAERIESWKGRWALITGASSGMGAAYARTLAEAGINLVLTARRAAELERIAAELTNVFGISALTEPADLGAEGAAEALHARIAERGLVIDILINNAGFGNYGRSVDSPQGRERSIIALNIVAVTELTRLFGADMAGRGWGRILEVASIGAFQPSPWYAAYGASKAFVLSYGVAVNEELAGTGVRVSVLCPGATDTAFFEVAGKDLGRTFSATLMPAERAARAGLSGLAAGKAVIVPGAMNKLFAFLPRIVSRRGAARVASALVRE